MSVHKHYDMIVAKAGDMDLVKFAKTPLGNWVVCQDQTGVNSTRFDPSWEYFLCLNKHKEACLHWLNGGDIQKFCTAEGFAELDWHDVCINSEWHDQHPFMEGSEKIRKSPKIKKKWIAYCSHTNQTIPHPQDNKDQAENYVGVHYQYPMTDWQFIEIEVEE